MISFEPKWTAQKWPERMKRRPNNQLPRLSFIIFEWLNEWMNANTSQMTAINNKNVIKTFSHSTHKSHPNLSVRKKIKFYQNSILFRFFSRFIFHENKSSENRNIWRKDACRTNQLIFYWYEWNRYRLEFLVFFCCSSFLFV